ncbi:hypothetical protein [Amycolatopsis sp. CA-128772]|uniref:hypothetical protein n=1 Tax=Amycolatopsis sp. CA-128772 TaxID=2073159 RepID=UPI000CD049DB|nr:hypothetical protein [Amycolatopsis sp. CA-128772]
MPAFLLPRLPRGTASVARLVVVSVPATLAILFGVLILFIALFMNKARQPYALRAANAAFGAARVMTGSSASEQPPEGAQRSGSPSRPLR